MGCKRYTFSFNYNANYAHDSSLVPDECPHYRRIESPFPNKCTSVSTCAISEHQGKMNIWCAVDTFFSLFKDDGFFEDFAAVETVSQRIPGAS